ncbi:clathrin-adaptor protein [Sarcoptes scabiei]|nr:clathrin-adaptor protein [Sarcoptes scabiei]
MGCTPSTINHGESTANTQFIDQTTTTSHYQRQRRCDLVPSTKAKNNKFFNHIEKERILEKNDSRLNRSSSPSPSSSPSSSSLNDNMINNNNSNNNHSDRHRARSSNSSSQTNNYLCGLLSFSMDLCYHCHPHTDSHRQHSEKERKNFRFGRRKKILKIATGDNGGGDGRGDDDCDGAERSSRLSKPISASLTGLHSLIDRESNCSQDEFQRLSNATNVMGNASSDNLSPPPPPPSSKIKILGMKKLQSSKTNSIQPNSDRINHYDLNKNVKNSKLIIDDNNNENNHNDNNSNNNNNNCKSSNNNDCNRKIDTSIDDQHSNVSCHLCEAERKMMMFSNDSISTPRNSDNNNLAQKNFDSIVRYDISEDRNTVSVWNSSIDQSDITINNDQTRTTMPVWSVTQATPPTSNLNRWPLSQSSHSSLSSSLTSSRKFCCRHSHQSKVNESSEHHSYCCLHRKQSDYDCSRKNDPMPSSSITIQQPTYFTSLIASSSSANTKDLHHTNQLGESSMAPITTATTMFQKCSKINQDHHQNCFNFKHQQQQQQQSSQSSMTSKMNTNNKNNKSVHGLIESNKNSNSSQLHQQQRINNDGQSNQSIRFGRMNVSLRKPRLLLVTYADRDDDREFRLLSKAAKRIGFEVIINSVHNSNENVLNAYIENQFELIIIDVRDFDFNSLRNSPNQTDCPANNGNQTGCNNNNHRHHLIDLHSAKDSDDGHHHSHSHHSHPYSLNDSNDSKQSRSINLCKSIRSLKLNEFTTIVALIDGDQIYGIDFNDDDNDDNDDGGGGAETSQSFWSRSQHFLRQIGFNKSISSSKSSPNHYLNELNHLKEFDLVLQQRLRASSILFQALDNCKDGVIITGPQHDIRYANHSIEKMFGFRLDDLIGQRTQDFFQNDLLKFDVDEKIHNYNDGKEWEGSIYHRRKSGESVPIWNRILPINYHQGVPEHIVYIKEYPFFCIEKLYSPDKESLSSHGSFKGHRKYSVDCRNEARRPSLAKFNSISLIEAPITKVINILMMIKENGPNSLAPTLEKAIDILKNSEIFTNLSPQLQNLKPDDQLTSELVCSLISTNKTQANRRMSHEVASNKSSISYTTSTNSVINTNSNSNNSNNANNINDNNMIASAIPAEIQSLLDDDLKWNFDVIELERITSKSPLLWLGQSILEKFNVRQTLNCNDSTIRNWLTVIESNYRNNPYHNSTHAADVMQATACFLQSERLRNLLDPLDQAICLIAAIIHDIDHPGRNSAFLSNSNHELALLYNDISILESHHAAYGFRLTVGDNSDHINIFKNLDRETYIEVRQSIIDMVLATEMTKHFEHLSKFVNVFQTFTLNDTNETTLIDTLEQTKSSSANLNNQASNKIYRKNSDEIACSSSTTPADVCSMISLSEWSSPENIVLIKRMLIKCADVSNPGRNIKLCRIWAERIASEYCDQTEEEKIKGLPLVMPTFDSKNCSIPKSQIGFIDYFANDMFEAWHCKCFNSLS